jgi:hypothetical protein
MNCLEFRRHVGAEPSTTLPAVLAHCEECAACARYRDEMRSLDRLLGKAMRVDVAPASAREGSGPAEGAARYSLAEEGSDPSYAGRRAVPAPRRWLAMAASLVAGVLVAATLWLSYPETTLAAEVIGHVVSEPDAMKSSQPLAAQAITEVLQPSGVRLRPGIGTVTFAMRCVFEGRVVPHLVVGGWGGGAGAPRGGAPPPRARSPCCCSPIAGSSTRPGSRRMATRRWSCRRRAAASRSWAGTWRRSMPSRDGFSRTSTGKPDARRQAPALIPGRATPRGSRRPRKGTARRAWRAALQRVPHRSSRAG